MIKLRSIVEEIIAENQEDWNKDAWVHYSDVPYIKIHPRQKHQDPSGIYLFPKEFAAKSDFWAAKKYAFIVRIKPNTNVLDVGTLTAKDCEDLIRKIAPDGQRLEKWVEDVYKAERKEELFHGRHPFDVVWEFMGQHFLGKYGQWNKALRKLGYDAIFDDTNSIHSREVQMIVLDPRKIEVVDVKSRKGSGYHWIILVAEHIREMMVNYKGHWIIGRAKKNTYGKLELFMKFSNLSEDKWEDDAYRYVAFNIYATESNMASGAPPYEIYVSFSSTPSKPYGIGARFNIIDKNWEEVDRLKKEIDDVLTSPVKYRDSI